MNMTLRRLSGNELVLRWTEPHARDTTAHRQLALALENAPGVDYVAVHRYEATIRFCDWVIPHPDNQVAVVVKTVMNITIEGMPLASGVVVLEEPF